MTQTTPAGWYPNPDNATQLRWWDGAAWTERVQASISEQAPGEVGAGLSVYTGPPIVVVTMNDMPGYRITEIHGEVFGITVRARNAFSNMGAGFRTMFGGFRAGPAFVTVFACAFFTLSALSRASSIIFS